MQTLPLNTASWDLEPDSLGNLSLADPDYSIAQDVASAIRTFMASAGMASRWRNKGAGVINPTMLRCPALSYTRWYHEQPDSAAPDQLTST